MTAVSAPSPVGPPPQRPPGPRTAEGAAGLLRRYRWPVLATWVLLLVVAGVLGRPLPGLLSGGGWYVDGSQSDLAAEAVSEGFLARGATTVTLVVQDERFTSDTPEFAARVREVAQEVAADPELEVTGSYGWTTLGEQARQPFVGEDGRTVITLVALGLEDGDARMLLPEVQDELTQRYEPEGLQVTLVSAASFWGEVNVLSEEGLARAELITLPLVLLILLLLYRSVVASLVSLVVAVTAIVLSFGVLAVLARSVELSVFVRSAVTMLGLGVGVDYSLFMISRFTAELRAGQPTSRALVTMLRTSGETVLSSALVVVLAMSTLFLVPLGVVQSIAFGCVLVVALAALVSVLVLPVILLLLGPRIERLRVPVPWGRRRAASGSGWETLTRSTMRRPWTVLAVTLAALLALAWPALQVQVFTADARIVPTTSPVRQGYDVLRAQFGPGAPSPMPVVVESAGGLAGSGADDELAALQERLEQLPGVARVDSPLGLLSTLSPGAPLAALEESARAALPGDARASVDHFVSSDGERLVLDVVPSDAAASAVARTLVEQVRQEAARTASAAPGLSVVVGGETAEGVDSNAAITDRLPAALGLMLAIIFVMLLLTFRSLLLPVKAIAMNVLSAAAAFGVLVLVFQEGVGVEALGAEPSTHLQNIVPVLLLALLFSLSTDYEIFLLSRVREEWVRTGDGTASVARGVAQTGPLISGAAALMVAVFGAFALASILPIQQLGLGLAIAIALDATIIRLFVVPASMRLLGDWNWWLPSLRRRPAASAPEPAEVPAPRSATPAASTSGAAPVPERPVPTASATDTPGSTS